MSRNIIQIKGNKIVLYPISWTFCPPSSFFTNHEKMPLDIRNTRVVRMPLPS